MACVISVVTEVILDEGDWKELSPTGLTGDYTEPRQKVGFTYTCV